MNDTRRRPADLGAPPATPRPRTSVFGLLPSIFGILTSALGLRTSPFRLRTPLLPCLLATTLFLAARPAFTDDRQFLAGLRQRQLFDLAALYCESRLADTDLTARQWSELVVELSRTHAEHALNSPPGERDAPWAAAGQVVADFSTRFPQHARLKVVQLQASLALLARGELGRQEAEVLAASPDRWDQPRSHLRSAIAELELLEQSVAEGLRSRNQPADGLTEWEWLRLQKNIHYQLARALRNQAQSYPAGSADRSNALTRSLAHLNPLVTLDADEPLTWPARVDQIICLRLLEDFAAAESRLSLLEQTVPPPEIRPSVRAERIRLLLAGGQLADARNLLEEAREQPDPTSGQLDMALLETYVALWRAADRAGQQAQVAALQEQAMRLVRHIEQHWGPYWTRRAEMVVADAATIGSGASNLDVLIATAQNFYRRGQLQEAVPAFLRAADKAREMSDAASGLQLMNTAARIEHDLGRHQAAVEHFRAAALSFADQDEAGTVHLWAILNASQLAQQDPAALDRYLQLLREHVARWPTGSSSNTARRWLGQLHVHQRNEAAAIEAYQGIGSEFPDFPRVVADLERLWIRQLARLRDDAAPSYPHEADRAARFFENLLLGDERGLPEHWTPAHRSAAVAAARIRIDHSRQADGAAEQLLIAALEGSPDADPVWRSTAQSLLVVAMATQGRQAAAQQILSGLADGSPQQLLMIVSALARLSPSAGRPPNLALANLQLAATELLLRQRDQLDPSDQRRLDQAHAEALAAAGQLTAATRLYAELARTQPAAGNIQEGYAQLLLDSGDRESLQPALRQWRLVLAKSPAHTERWYRAKYSLAQVHFQLGDKRRAAELIRLLQAVPPGLEQTPLKPQFLQLLAECDR